MALINWFKRIFNKKEHELDNSQIKETAVKPLNGLRLTTFNEIIEEPTAEQIKQAAQDAINAFDEFVLLEWQGTVNDRSVLQGIGFGDCYRLEYTPKNAQEGYAYVKEGVLLEDAFRYFLAFKQSHQVMIDGTWQWQKIV